MTKGYRRKLPQMEGGLFLTDGGMETTLIFREGHELPEFAAFDLMKSDAGRDALRKYYQEYEGIARQNAVGLILESVGWRASADWGAKLGYDRAALARVNRESIALLEEIRREWQSEETQVVVSGCVGPRGDGYQPGAAMTAAEAEEYHLEQIQTYSETAADMVCAMTLNYAEEAIGIVRAARRAEMPVAISFTLETDGRLPAGETLRSAVKRVDAETGFYCRYFMLNCAHPSHFEHLFTEEETWMTRIRGIRANASKRSHCELNEAPDLDSGDPHELAREYRELMRMLPNLRILGGCCGTDHRHVRRIAEACVPVSGAFPVGARAARG